MADEKTFAAPDPNGSFFVRFMKRQAEDGEAMLDWAKQTRHRHYRQPLPTETDCPGNEVCAICTAMQQQKETALISVKQQQESHKIAANLMEFPVKNKIVLAARDKETGKVGMIMMSKDFFDKLSQQLQQPPKTRKRWYQKLWSSLRGLWKRFFSFTNKKENHEQDTSEVPDETKRVGGAPGLGIIQKDHTGAPATIFIDKNRWGKPKTIQRIGKIEREK